MFKLALFVLVLTGCVTIKVEPANCPAPVQPIVHFGESTCCMPTLDSNQHGGNILQYSVPSTGAGTLRIAP